MSGDLNESEWCICYLLSQAGLWLYEQLNERFGAEVIWIMCIFFAAVLKSRNSEFTGSRGGRGKVVEIKMF